MIIIQGRNFYPQDIELGVEKCHAALRPHCGAAFALEDDQTERLVMVQELNREFRKSESLPEISNLIRQTIAKNHGLRAHAVVLIMPSTIPKTTSGKIQRRAARDLFIAGQLDVLYEWRAPGAFGHIELQRPEEKR
jgi:acyl-CoA synthetase (AMP-forming)/AMP-acid ligase II